MQSMRYRQDNTNKLSAILGAGVMPGSGGSLGLSAKPPEQRTVSRLPAPAGSRGAAPAYLVETLRKSAQETDIAQVSQPDDIAEVDRKNPCDSWRSIRGTCNHGSTRWLYVRCKRRDCAGCSKVRQWLYASRIANGVRSIGVNRCAFIVLTYADPRSADPKFKPEAVKLEHAFLRWLRSEQRKLGNPKMEYAKTWEIQPQSKRLHTNLVVGPWMKLDIDRMRERWGSRISISWVRDDESVSREATKAQSPDGLSTYLTKLEQMVPANWHRAISFSKGYPKLEPVKAPERVGEILWESERQLEPGARDKFEFDKSRGWWVEVEPGAGEYVGLLVPEMCRCYEWVNPDPPPETYYHPPENITAPDLRNEVQRRQLAEIYS